MSKSQTKLKKTIKTIFAVTAVVISALFILTFTLPRVVGCKSFYIGADTMSPAIVKGSLVITKSVEFTDIKVGDILTFTDSHTAKSFTHRVADIYSEKKQLVTKGDANESVDPYTTSFSCVEGRVVFNIPLVGYPMLVINTIYGKIAAAVIYIFWLAFEIEAFRSRKKEGDSQ